MAPLTSSPSYPVLRLRQGGHKRLVAGHPWLYSNEIEMDAPAKALPPGGLVRLAAAGGEALGVAGFNPHSLIAARRLTPDPGACVDRDFVRVRLAAALALRETLFDTPYYRWVHAEADSLPGLVLDRYGSVIVGQANTATMRLLAPQIEAAVQDLVSPQAMIWRNDSPVSRLEGLEEEERMAFGQIPADLEIEENGGHFRVDPQDGQKTGWFFDQRDNRALVARMAKGRTLLDLYSFAGGFGVTAARMGAARVVGVDASAHAVELANGNAVRNDVSGHCQFIKAEAFDYLEQAFAAGVRFEMVSADPPAFVRSRKDLNAGARGYRKLTRLCAMLVSPGGFLFLASCSHHVPPELLLEQAARGLHDAGRQARLLRQTGAGMDHPVHPQLPESAYLKGLLFALD